MCQHTARHLLVSQRGPFLNASTSPRISSWSGSPMRCSPKRRSSVHDHFSDRQEREACLGVLGQVRGPADTAASSILIELHTAH